MEGRRIRLGGRGDGGLGRERVAMKGDHVEEIAAGRQDRRQPVVARLILPGELRAQHLDGGIDRLHRRDEGPRRGAEVRRLVPGQGRLLIGVEIRLVADREILDAIALGHVGIRHHGGGRRGAGRLAGLVTEQRDLQDQLGPDRLGVGHRAIDLRPGKGIRLVVVVVVTAHAHEARRQGCHGLLGAGHPIAIGLRPAPVVDPHRALWARGRGRRDVQVRDNRGPGCPASPGASVSGPDPGPVIAWRWGFRTGQEQRQTTEPQDAQ